MKKKCVPLDAALVKGSHGAPAATAAQKGVLLSSEPGIFLGGWYLFTMLKNVCFGPLHEPHHEGHAVSDLNGRELAAMIPLAAVCLALGLYPQPVLDSAKKDVNTVVKIVSAARDRAAAVPAAAN